MGFFCHTEEGLYTRNVCVGFFISLNINFIFYYQVLVLASDSETADYSLQ